MPHDGGEDMKNINSMLKLDQLVFDKIEFNRKGFQNNEEVTFEIEVQIGQGNDEVYKVTLILKGDKEDEYDFLISLTGFFSFEAADGVADKQKESLINKNAIAILMPYLRSEVSLLTAQPNVECIVLPPFNINKMLEEKE